MATLSSSAHNDTLTDALAPLQHRLTTRRVIRLAARGALVGAALSLLLASVAHWSRVPEAFPLVPVLVILIVAGAGGGAVIARLRPVTLLQAARLAEAHGELKERLSSALALSASAANGQNVNLLRLQQQDAISHARQIDPVRTVPLRWPPEAKGLALVLLLLALLLWLPTLPFFVPPVTRTEREIVQKAGLKLIRQGQEIEKQGAAQHLPQTQRAGQQMQKLGQQMAQGHMDKRQALAQAAQVSKQMADAGRQARGDGKSSASDTKASASDQQAGRSADQPASSAQAKKAAEQAHKTAKQSAASTSHNKPQASKTSKHSDPSHSSKQTNKAAGTGKSSSSGAQTQAQRDAQGVQDAQKSVDNERQEVAQASGPKDVSDRPTPQNENSSPPSGKQQNSKDSSHSSPSGQPSPQGPSKSAQGQPQTGKGSHPSSSGNGQQTQAGSKSGQQKPAGSGQQPGSHEHQGSQGQSGKSGTGGRPAPGGSGKSAPTPGQQASGQPGTEHRPGSDAVKAPHALNPKFHPSASHGYGKVYLGQGEAGKGSKTVQAAPGQAGPQTSTVPATSVLPKFQKGAEAAMDREDVPPAYKDSVRQYFNNLGRGK